VKLPEFWKTGVLLLVLAGLGSYIWFVERKQEPKPEGERAKVTVLAVDKAKAKEISLAAAGGETIRLVKEGAGWKVTSPFTAPADTSAVESILTSLEKLEADEVVVEQAANPAEFGLDKPSRTITAVVEGAPASLSVEFGRRPRRLERLRPRGRDAEGLPRPSWVEGSFDKKPFDLRDRDLLHVKRTTSGRSRSRGPRAATPSPGRTPASGRSRSPSPPAPAAGRWTASWARWRTCEWTRSPPMRRPT